MAVTDYQKLEWPLCYSFVSLTVSSDVGSGDGDYSS